MPTITAKQVAASLKQLYGIESTVVLEGNPKSHEHGEISIKAKRPITVFVSPIDDTVYVAVWNAIYNKHGESDDGNYTYSKVRHYVGELSHLAIDVVEAMTCE